MNAPDSGPLRLLYLSAMDVASGDNILAPASRIAVGMLSRDFIVSLAVAGDISTVGMNRLRVDLGPVRVAGGFESSSTDRRAQEPLRPHLQERFGSDAINARLQNAIERKSEDFDAVVVDDLAAWPYRPVSSDLPLVFLARQVYSTGEPPRRRFWRRREKTLRSLELSAYEQAHHVFARPEVAYDLSDIGVPLRLLQDNYRRPASGSPTFDDADFSLTGNRLGYSGYLGFKPNLASLDWFLSGVWPALREHRPGIELHIVGSAPEEQLQERLGDLEDVYFHWGANDRKLLELGCRVVVDPLLYENHVDAKLVNAMARALPVVTTKSATHRAHSDLGNALGVATGTDDMVTTIDALMSDQALWKRTSDEARRVAAALLPDFEVAHAMRRAIARLSNGSDSA